MFTLCAKKVRKHAGMALLMEKNDFNFKEFKIAHSIFLEKALPHGLLSKLEPNTEGEIFDGFGPTFGELKGNAILIPK